MDFSKRLLIILILKITYGVQTCIAQNASNQEMMSKFIDIVEKNAYKSSLVNWDSIRVKSQNQVSNTIDMGDLRSIFEQILSQLKDSHSSIFYTEEASEGSENEVLKQYATVTYEEAGHPFPDISGKMIEGKYAYLKVPGVLLEHKKYVQYIGEQIETLDKQNPKAWIFDVADNDGGTIWPMLWHMYDFIDQDNIHSYVDRYGIEKKITRSMWDKANLDDQDMEFFELTGLSDESLTPINVANKKAPIFILADRKTASSGELFVAAFKGQKNVTVIGQTTNGLTSVNETFPLNNHYLINLTTSVIKDRNGKIYKIGEGIKPDVDLQFFANPEIKEADQSTTEENRAKMTVAYINQLGF